MSVQNISQLKQWFKKGAYPTEGQFADLIDSFRHKHDGVGLAEVSGLAGALNKKYDVSEARILEKTVGNHTSQINWLNTVQERQAEEIDELEYLVESQQAELNLAKDNVVKISNLLNSGASLDETKAALESLGSNYAGLYALAVTVKAFLESTDTKEATINTWQEIEEFLQGITDTDSLTGLLSTLEANITEAYNTAISEALEDVNPATVTELTYSELVAMRDANELTAGAYYRITDYETTVANDEEAQSAGHPFDLIVKAIDYHTLSEEAVAAHSARDDDEGYFGGSMLEAWKVWYRLDNDQLSFYWADVENGKGVIYRMIDEFGNDCPYDFKNIMFRRYLCEGDFLDRNDSGLYDEEGNSYSLNRYLLGDVYGEDYYPSGTDEKWFYTFSVVDNENNISDASIGGNCFACKNIIKPSIGSCYIDGAVGAIQELSNIVLTGGGGFGATQFNYFGGHCSAITLHCGSSMNTFIGYNVLIEGYAAHGNQFEVGAECVAMGMFSSGNKIGTDCYDIQLDGECCHNRFIGECYYITLGKACFGNLFEYGVYEATLGNGCHSNHLERWTSDNMLGNECSNNHFGRETKYNQLGDCCSNNEFGAVCESNELGLGSRYNVFGAGFHNNILGQSCVGNQFGYNCFHNTLGSNITAIKVGCNCNNNIFNSYEKNLTVGDDVTYIEVAGGTSSSPAKNAEILSGVQGNISERLLIQLIDIYRVQYVGMTPLGQLKIWDPTAYIN